MDEQVLAAMARWPNVPAAFGWLSLSRRGQWFLHPQGRGWGHPDEEPGEAITNPRIAAFMGRNYQSDEHGRWFFQNGPQRVYVRVDGAPWILRMEPDVREGARWTTHTGQAYGPVTHWWLDDEGCLYAQASQGAGLVADRDLAGAIDALRLPDGRSLGAWLENAPDPSSGGPGITVRLAAPADAGGAPSAPSRPAVPLDRLSAAAVETALGFVRRPR
jgi:hypothetical protein